MTALAGETTFHENTPGMMAVPDTALIGMTPTTPASWLHTNVRNLVSIGLFLLVCYLAILGNSQAQASMIAAFTVLMGALWGERSALKVPGKDS